MIDRRRLSWWQPAVIGVAVLVPTVILWLALAREREAQLRRLEGTAGSWVAPGPLGHGLAWTASWVPEIVAGAGLLTAGLMALAVHLARAARGREQAAEIANRALRESEERRRKGEEQYRSLVATIPSVVWQTDPTGRMGFISPNIEAVLGFTPHEIYEGGSALWRERVHPEDRARLRAAYEALFSRGEGFDAVWRVQRKDGQWVWLHSRAKRVRQNGGESAHGVLDDVTARKLAEQSIEEQRAMLDTILREAADCIVVFDAMGRVRFVNPAARRLAAADPAGTSLDTAASIWGEAYDIAGCPLRVEEWAPARALQGETVRGLEARMVRPDGSFYDVLVSAAPLREAQGAVVGAVATFVNITERKRAEEALRDANAALEQRGAELAAVNAELDSFAYSVSHDLRAPLRAIHGFARVLVEDCAETLDAQGRHYLERLRVAAERMGQLIDDLLELSRASRRELRRSRVDISALAYGIARTLREREPSRPVKFHIHPGLTADADEGLIRVVLENLMGNAWKFTSKRPEASIEVGAKEINGRRAYFVQDDGAGFDPAYAEKLFGAFQRLHSDTEFEGTGIGLATVRRIVQRHGGRVWAEGAVDKGALFYFTLSGPAG